ncbi:hypothetical protein A2Y99_01030 [Candidatus Gottesmanbacteria bacterium RBG_13_37_7]|uniref:Glycosyltransferase RgtA/B/C/D-like domain-containing protein n=1 Tax=Candidatus Gottesmanbacteria bacterium RBG_13_37_7 TaxID=1798369 RepID=A0A1F5YJR3_9BACT|nr:MAG: hypothetical protein A2Y99_01030 [Candidatus Gottesmanbacteria bacterium RBG_13_37_7]
MKRIFLKNSKQTVFVVLLLVALFYKLWFISLAPQPIIYDQNEYISYAKSILEKGLTGVTSRTYGYPLLLSFVFLVWGNDNFQAVFAVQAIIDILSALILFYLALRVFKSQKVAWTALIIQLFNPFTTGYIGVILTEIFSSFLLILSVLIFTNLSNRFKESGGNIDGKTIIMSVFLGFVVGFNTQARPAFYNWNLLVIVSVPLILMYHRLPIKRLIPSISMSTSHVGDTSEGIPGRSRLNRESLGKRERQDPRQTLITLFMLFFFIILGTLIASGYQIVSNLKLFNQFSLTTVDSFFARELYDGALLKVTPLFPNNSWAYPVEMQLMYQEYSVLPKNAHERHEMANKYFNMAVELIKKDPVDYAVSRVKKMWNMWQKPNIFFYYETNFDKHWIYTYFLNLAILGLSFYGLILGILSQNLVIKKMTVYSLVLLTYMTVAIAFTHAEPRLTIPAYPVLFLFASYGLVSILETLVHIDKRI